MAIPWFHVRGTFSRDLSQEKGFQGIRSPRAGFVRVGRSLAGLSCTAWPSFAGLLRRLPLGDMFDSSLLASVRKLEWTDDGWKQPRQRVQPFHFTVYQPSW